MAATGYTPIYLYYSSTATNQPSAGNLGYGELAINITDKNLFFKDNTNAVNVVPIRQSSASSNGWLSSTDWSTFNSKQPAGSYALTTGTLAQFASTTSAQLAGVISDETGSGSLVFGTSPTISSPTISSGNLTFSTTGQRITGDFSNATLSNRLSFQSSTTNGNTSINILPNGTATATSFVAYNNSDPTNASTLQLLATSTYVAVNGGVSGTGTYLPLIVNTNNGEKLRIAADSTGTFTFSGYNAGALGPTLTLANTAGGISDGMAINFSSGAGGVRAQIQTIVENNPYYGAITFSTGSGSLTERMRIFGGGGVSIGNTTDPGAGCLNVNGTALIGKTSTGAATLGWQLSNTDSNAKFDTGRYFIMNRDNDDILINFRRSNSSVGTITVTTTATAYNTSSDYRLKENVKPMQNALDVVSQLNPVTYTWKTDGSDGQGFIAHELQAVVPQCVTGEKDAKDDDGEPKYQGIDTSFLVATLTKAIQEQQALIQSLTERVAAMEK